MKAERRFLEERDCHVVLLVQFYYHVCLCLAIVLSAPLTDSCEAGCRIFVACSCVKVSGLKDPVKWCIM